MANNAEAWRAGKHPGYEETAWAGIEQTIDVIAQKGIRVVINGSVLDPKALAEKVDALVCQEPKLASSMLIELGHREKPQRPSCISLWR